MFSYVGPSSRLSDPFSSGSPLPWHPPPSQSGGAMETETGAQSIMKVKVQEMQEKHATLTNAAGSCFYCSFAFSGWLIYRRHS